MERKWVHFLFVSLWLGIIFLFVKIGKFFWASSRTNSYQDLIIYGLSIIISLIFVVALWRIRKLRDFILECVVELEKVSWPTGKDTFSATLVVIIVVILVSGFLGLFDYIWKRLLIAIY